MTEEYIELVCSQGRVKLRFVNPVLDVCIEGGIRLICAIGADSLESLTDRIGG